MYTLRLVLKSSSQLRWCI